MQSGKFKKKQMLAVKSQGKIVERILKTKVGEQVLATFFVVEENGELQIRLLSIRSIERFRIQDSGFKNGTICLPGAGAKSPAVTAYRHNYFSVVSPFFNTLEFFVSQPTRAPSPSADLR